VSSEDERPDAERYEVGPREYGGPVDAEPHIRPTLYANVVAGETAQRRPIVAAEWRNPEQRRAVLLYAAGTAGYHAAFHATRTPKYLGKVLLYSPVGAVRGLWRVLFWTFDLESWGIRQHAATRNATDDYLSLSRHRDKRVSRRVWLTGPAAGVTLIAAVILRAAAPAWLLWTVLATALVGLAWIGRPKDKPILDRVLIGERFTRLTAEMVRGALLAVGIARIKLPGDVQFAEPGIHRDGPGWLARVNLPEGVEAVEVLERRGRLSSALRLPIDQVWPTAGPDHAGQLDLWVGYLPASKMGQPRWSLARPDARTSVFAPTEFGTDQRQRPIKTPLFALNFLIGGRPGSGKSYAARTIATIAALDPTCELKIVEYKGTGDFADFEPLCSTYACGLSGHDFQTGLDMLTWGLAEAERRGARVRAAKARGDAPEGKVTPELAARPGSGLHPVVMVIDEAHELFGDPEVGKDAAAAAERLAKRGRALGLILVICTQIPDRTSLPPGITRNMGVRWCLAVPDQVANDMILGTGAYKRGLTGTVYRPIVDAGWGVMVGLPEAGSVRAQFPTHDVTAKIMARATALRGGVVGSALDAAPERDVLADVLRVFAYIGRPGVHWQQLAELLAQEEPEAYGRHTPESLSALLRATGLPSVDVKDQAGAVRKGVRRADVQSAIKAREVTDGR
jgi:S-DNA-T family DNA segregation ATPase FtsK/SpoIIIE